MSEPQIDVAYIAKLAKLDLNDEETARFTQDLNEVLERVAQLEAWDVTGIAPMAHPLPYMDAMRPDCAGQSISNEAAMSNAPMAQEGQIRVPKVVESAHS